MIETFVDAQQLKWALATAANAASTDSTLPVLCGVRVTFTIGAVHTEATDRYVLIGATIPASGTGGRASIILPNAEVKRWVTAIGREKGTVIVRVGDGVATLAIGATQLTATPVDADYPDTRRLWPELPDTGTDTVALAPGNLAKLAKIKMPDGTPWKITTGGENKPVTATAGGEGYAVAVLIMPVRVGMPGEPGRTAARDSARTVIERVRLPL